MIELLVALAAVISGGLAIWLHYLKRRSSIGPREQAALDIAAQTQKENDAIAQAISDKDAAAIQELTDRSDRECAAVLKLRRKKAGDPPAGGGGA